MGLLGWCMYPLGPLPCHQVVAFITNWLKAESLLSIMASGCSHTYLLILNFREVKMSAYGLRGPLQFMNAKCKFGNC